MTNKLQAFWLQGFAQNISVTGNVIERPGFCGAYVQGIWPGDTTANSTAASTSEHPGGPIQSAAAADVNHGHLFADNWVHDYGQRVGHGSGFWLFQAGRMRLTRNHIQEGPRDAFGIYGVRFGNGAGGAVLPREVYGVQLDFWSAMDVLHTRNIEIDHNTVANAVRDTGDAGALEYWGVGAWNTAHHNCFSDMDPGVLDGSWMNFLFQDDGSNYLNFSSNIVFEVKGSGWEEAGMMKSVGSVFEHSIIADSTLGHLFNMGPYIEPAANMIFRHNIFSNINSTSNPNLDVTLGKLATGDMNHSQNKRCLSNYGFEHPPPPGWPPLNLTDKVIQELDDNTYWEIYKLGARAGTTADWNVTLAASQKLGYENNSVYQDPQLQGTTAAGRASTPWWNRTCADHIPAASSPVYARGFRPINASAIGLSAAFAWDLAACRLGRVDGLGKIQTERYNRMHGLWRAGSTGISPGNRAGGPMRGQADFLPDAWARYDLVDVHCPPPSCQMTLSFRSAAARHIMISVGAPEASRAVVALTIPIAANWTEVTAPVPHGLVAEGATLFLLVNGSCTLDYFRFLAGAPPPLGH